MNMDPYIDTLSLGDERGNHFSWSDTEGYLSALTKNVVKFLNFTK